MIEEEGKVILIAEKEEEEKNPRKGCVTLTTKKTQAKKLLTSLIRYLTSKMS